MLAKYVVALLRKDDNDNEIQANCIDQLRDFLKDETTKFVESLFKTLEGSWSMFSTI